VPKTAEPVKQALATVTRHARVHDTAEVAVRKALRAADAEGLTKARLEAARKRTRAARTKADGERATRDQAIRAARDVGATVKQIANAAQLSESTVRNVISKGPFGRPSARAAAAAQKAP
jgi:DNA-binding NarL/FixJ family response regulator